MKLEVAMLVGPEAKAFLASLTTQIDRLEKITAKDALAIAAAGKKKNKKVEDENEDEEIDEEAEEKEADEDDADDSDDDSEDDEDSDDDDADDESDDEDEDADDESDDEDEDEVEEKKPAKKAAAGKKKIALADVKDACKNYMREHDRKAVMKVLKKFKVESTEDLDPAQYADVIKALAI